MVSRPGVSCRPPSVPFRRIEGVTNRDIEILMSMIVMLLLVDATSLLEYEFLDPPSKPCLCDDYCGENPEPPAGKDPVTKTLEFAYPFIHRIRDRSGLINIVKTI